MKTPQEQLTLRELQQKAENLGKNAVIHGTGYGYRIELKDKEDTTQ